MFPKKSPCRLNCRFGHINPGHTKAIDIIDQKVYNYA